MEDADEMTKQNGPTKERELILDILLEILEYGGYSHVVLKKHWISISIWKSRTVRLLQESRKEPLSIF